MRKQTLDTVFNSYPILKNYIYTHNDAEELYKKTILPQTNLTVLHRSGFDDKLWLSWDSMSIFINIYSQYNNTDNVAVIPSSALAYAKEARRMRLEITKLNLKLNVMENEEEKKNK